MKALIVDSSVAIKWVFDEPGTEEALSLLKFPLQAPDLLVAECANILWKKHRLGQMSYDEASYAHVLLDAVQVTYVAMSQLQAAAIRLAIELEHPAYDCFYMALAEAEKSFFVTADERLCRKLHGRKERAWVLNLMTDLGQLGLPRLH